MLVVDFSIDRFEDPMMEISWTEIVFGQCIR